jgi:hypothetical protein
MPRIKDAASMAALDMPMPGGMPPLDPAALAGAAPPEEEMPGGDVEGAMATIEGALSGAPPDKAEEARTHLNALREIFSGIGAESAPPPGDEELPPPDELPPPEMS